MVSAIARFWIAFVLWLSAYADHTLNAKLQEALSLSVPTRTALSIACFEGDLRGGTGHDELDLKAPEAYQSTYTIGVGQFCINQHTAGPC